MVAWSIAGLAWNGATAQDSTLKDNLGRTIEVRIISATKTHVVCIKASDTKEVTIALDSLDAESQCHRSLQNAPPVITSKCTTPDGCFLMD